MKFIYLAVPYSSPDPTIARARYELVTKVAGWLMADYVVFSPITHSHCIEQLWDDGAKRWDFWKIQDLEIIRRVDEVHVLTIKGWKESEGVQAEIAFCDDINTPVRFIHPGSLPMGLAQEAKRNNLI